jgi:hypothetical protein
MSIFFLGHMPRRAIQLNPTASFMKFQKDSELHNYGQSYIKYNAFY